SNQWTIWTANITALVPGTNVIRVRARDESGNLSTEVTRTLTYVSLDHLILITNGAGTIVPNLAPRLLKAGTVQTITAVPATGFVFSNWTGGLMSSSAKLTFVMQPNLTLQANFVPNPFARVSGGYNGLFYVDEGVRPESSGFFTFNLTARGSYSGQLSL